MKTLLKIVLSKITFRLKVKALAYEHFINLRLIVVKYVLEILLRLLIIFVLKIYYS
jgi:hypothetical protein